MKKKKLAKGLATLEEELPSCEACQIGKQTRLPFTNSTWTVNQKLHLIHTKLGGPQRTPLLKRSGYYIILIDNLSRMC